MREVELEDAGNRCHRIIIDVPPVAVYKGPRDGTTGLTLPGHRKVVVAGEEWEVAGKIAAALGESSRSRD
jgi:hypothetical protein